MAKSKKRSVKTRTCTKGFTCGDGCISRSKICRSNLGPDGNKLVEDYAAFVKRIAAEAQSTIVEPTAPSGAGQEVNQDTLFDDLLDDLEIAEAIGDTNVEDLREELAPLVEPQPTPQATPDPPSPAPTADLKPGEELLTPEQRAFPPGIKRHLIKQLQKERELRKDLSEGENLKKFNELQVDHDLNFANNPERKAEHERNLGLINEDKWSEVHPAHAWGQGGMSGADATKLRAAGVDPESKLSDKELNQAIRAAKAFSGENYAKIRSADAGRLKGKKSVEDARRVNQAIDVLPKHSSPVYRGISFGDAKKANKFIESLDSGEFETPSMTSFSTSSHAAEDFAVGASGTGEAGVLDVLIKVRENKSGASIAPLSELGEEQEVLVPKGIKHKIKGIKYDKFKGKMYIEVEET